MVDPISIAKGAEIVGKVGKGTQLIAALSEKSARDFKDAMGSIEDAGKMGVFSDFSRLIESMVGAMSSPFVKVWTDFFRTLEKFMSSGGAEAASKWREEMFGDEMIQRMGMMRDTWRAITLGVTDAMFAFDAFFDDLEAKIPELQQHMSDYFAQVYAEFALMPNALVSMIKAGFRAATSGLADWFKEWLEDMIEEAGG